MCESLMCFGGDPPPFPFEAMSFMNSPLSHNLGILNCGTIWKERILQHSAQFCLKCFFKSPKTKIAQIV